MIVKTLQFTIDREPRGKEAHRMTRAGHTYKPPKTVEFENAVKEAYIKEHGDTMLIGAIGVRIIAFMRWPKNTSKVKQEKMIKGEIRPTKKPDLDNISKAVCDALSGVAYDDDKQIVESLLLKYWDKEGSIQVKLMGELKE